MNQVSSNYELRLLERKQLELQINKYILDNPEKYLKKIDELFDRNRSYRSYYNERKIKKSTSNEKIYNSWAIYES